jgi:hypothetical protein
MGRIRKAATIVNEILARLWRLGGPLQWRFLWLAPDARSLRNAMTR